MDHTDGMHVYLKNMMVFLDFANYSPYMAALNIWIGF